MEVAKAIELRRSVKNYDPGHRISDDEIERLMSLAILSPTAFNIQNWRFVVVRDPELRKQLRAAAWDQAQVTDASLLIVLTADLKSWQKDPERYWINAAEPVREFMVPAIGQYYDGRDQVQRDEAMRSCGIAAMNLMLAAKEMGYDSCPMDGFDFDAVGKLIQLPEDHVVTLFVVVGKGVKEAWPRGGQLPLSEVLITDHF
ncbi:MAG: nitroreductase family protein [Sulfurimicrobium sp.]|jgi:nitroreductase|nr:nitroreductase family protein [Sulfurimicrobium sp.]MDP1704367.1 nitroreductase family protein [Sulfurimicrobium sp.]MDP2199925.1 nitroreductase family protein [Sulfurimicrobium sp.]MDP2962396.1 nitroreductase family protein [Sulfurimicrobium sp.]MDP3687241.1 nitroreductase family protein [Sulfurimicrobium sp.]